MGFADVRNFAQAFSISCPMQRTRFALKLRADEASGARRWPKDRRIDELLLTSAMRQRSYEIGSNHQISVYLCS